jgi:hypothetical protein
MGLLRKVITSEENLRQTLLDYGLSNPVYQGIVLDTPKDTGQDKFDKYFSLVSFMVASFGKTIRLPTDCALILLPGTKDRQLISHRLAKTLRANVLADFEAENPEQALLRIQTFL